MVSSRIRQGLHPADEALPRRLPLLHVRRAATEGRARVHVGGRGARGRASGRGLRLPRGAVHARRQAGAPLPRGTGGARRARLRDDDRVPRAHVPRRARGDRSASPRKPGRDDAGRAGCAPGGDGVAGDHARDGVDRLSERGGPHFGSPDKRPVVRLATIALAGELAIPFTSGILIGIGETRAERIDALLAIRDLHERHGHIQEVIVQNFRAKAGTKMVDAPEPSLEELLWTAAAARLVLGPEMNIQAPPNLSYDDFPRLLDAGINDWGGVSPVTIDHVNPEAPWPEIERLAAATSAARARAGRTSARLPRIRGRPLDRCWRVLPHILRASDASGLAREGSWTPGETWRSVRSTRGVAGRHARRARRGGDRAALPCARRGAGSRLRRC